MTRDALVAETVSRTGDVVEIGRDASGREWASTIAKGGTPEAEAFRQQPPHALEPAERMPDMPLTDERSDPT